MLEDIYMEEEEGRLVVQINHDGISTPEHFRLYKRSMYELIKCFVRENYDDLNARAHESAKIIQDIMKDLEVKKNDSM